MKHITSKLPEFVGGWEGFVSRTYIDPGGVPTIGHGFTMRSGIFADYWRKSRGRGLQRGDTIEKAESLSLLGTLLDQEYAPYVVEAIDGLEPHQRDACTSVTYNAGPGTLRDRWADALKARNVPRAAELLRVTRVTAGGRKLAGLVRRRAAESRLLEHGVYGDTAAPDEVAPSVSLTESEIRDYQRQLAELGFDPGPVDGIAGEKTKAAVEAFQRAQPNLVADGIVGPATRAALVRALAAKKAAQQTGGGAVATGGAGGAAVAADAPSWATWGLLALFLLVLIGGAFLAWRYRDEIKLFIRSRR